MPVRLRSVLLATLMAALTAAVAQPGPAAAKVRVGIGDQAPQMFADPNFRALGMRQVRYFVRWDVMSHRDERLRMRTWIRTARAAGARPLVHLSTHDYGRRSARLPSTARYRSQVRRLVPYLRRLGVRDFGVWNEVNHDSQPTYRSPARTAAYWKQMRRAVYSRCSRRTCRIVDLDVLDQAGVERYIARFAQAAGRSYTRRNLRVVGIHNYSDVNRRRTSGFRGIRSAVRRRSPAAALWLTETGGLIRFGRSFPCSTTRARNRLDFLFDTVHRYRRSIDRVYLYNWYGAGCQGRFDAGLVAPDGTPRPGYHEVRRQLRRFAR
jgi:hypothetical protein